MSTELNHNTAPTKALEPSSTYCAYAWMHARMTPRSQLTPCCNYIGETIPVVEGQTLQQMFESPFFAKLRSDMLAGKSIPGCQLCYKQETVGNVVDSMRTRINHQYPDVWQEKPKIRYVEFSFGTLCNLKCRGCSSMASSKWAKDEAILGLDVHELVKGPSTSALDGSWEHLEIVKLIGGEPLLYVKEHELLLKNLSEKSNLSELTLEYATNGTMKVSPFVLETWSKLKRLVLAFSVDGLKENNDYFREGTKWKDIIENIKWFREHAKNENLTIRIHSVVNIYNIHELVDLDDWLTAEFPESPLSKDFLVSPFWLDICNLPPKAKDDLIEFYKMQSERSDIDRYRKFNYTYAIKCLQAEPVSGGFARFVRGERKINYRWDYKLEDYHPRLAAIIADYEAEHGKC